MWKGYELELEHWGRGPVCAADAPWLMFGRSLAGRVASPPDCHRQKLRNLKNGNGPGQKSLDFRESLNTAVPTTQYPKLHIGLPPRDHKLLMLI